MGDLLGVLVHEEVPPGPKARGRAGGSASGTEGTSADPPETLLGGSDTSEDILGERAQPSRALPLASGRSGGVVVRSRLGALPAVSLPTFLAGAAAAGAWALVGRRKLEGLPAAAKFVAGLGGELLLDCVKPAVYVTTPRRTYPVEPWGSPKA